MKNLLSTLLVASSAIALSPMAHAALYTSTFGSELASPSNCDDCYAGEFGFGAGQSINFFGTTYSGLYVGSNGYVTFGGGATNYTTHPLNTQTIRPMIAGSFTDLDSRSDAASKVWIDDSTLGQFIITWDQMGHYSHNYAVRSTFQLVVRSDQFATPSGEGQIGFFYGSITDGSSTSAGFGDGLAAINAGEVAFHSSAAGTSLSNSQARWFKLAGGTPSENVVPEPGTLGLFGLTFAGLAALRRRKAS